MLRGLTIPGDGDLHTLGLVIIYVEEKQVLEARKHCMQTSELVTDSKTWLTYIR